MLFQLHDRLISSIVLFPFFLQLLLLSSLLQLLLHPLTALLKHPGSVGLNDVVHLLGSDLFFQIHFETYNKSRTRNLVALRRSIYQFLQLSGKLAFVYKFMIKTQSCKTVPRSLPKVRPQKGEVSTHRYEKDHNTSIAPINSTFDCNAYMNRLHKWKKQVRTKKLQVIYDENIRLFVSLAKQKSSYHFPNLKKSEFKRGLGRRLIPLTERNLAERSQ